MFVAHLDTVLNQLEPLELWDDERHGCSWDDGDAWDDYDDDDWQPTMPCHLMPPSTPDQR